MTQKRYVIVGKSIKPLLDYNSEYFLQGGLEAAISRWKTEDFELMNTNVSGMDENN
jgi:hypothetical protein